MGMGLAYCKPHSGWFSYLAMELWRRDLLPFYSCAFNRSTGAIYSHICCLFACYVAYVIAFTSTILLAQNIYLFRRHFFFGLPHTSINTWYCYQLDIFRYLLQHL